MLNYYELLSEMVEKSNLTLKEIAYKCGDLGVKVNPSYISKLKSGKQPPASEDVNRAIAEACGFKDKIEDLLFESYKEKAPNSINNLLMGIIEYFRESARQAFNDRFPKGVAETFEKQLDEASDLRVIWSALEGLKKSNEMDISSIEMNYYDGYKMLDDSMEPLIPKESKLHMDFSSEANNGDIVMLNDGTVRRYFFVETNIYLVSEKGDKQLVIKNKNDFEIIGIVRYITNEV